jgi:hypothetical protein
LISEICLADAHVDCLPVRRVCLYVASLSRKLLLVVLVVSATVLAAADCCREILKKGTHESFSFCSAFGYYYDVIIINRGGSIQ